MDINWYPGHMAKAKRLMKEKMPVVDIIFEVIDSRIPYSSKIRDIEEVVKGKERILVFTKMDLCDKEETSRWIEKYRAEGYKVIQLDLLKGDVSKVVELANQSIEELNQKRISKNMKPRSARVMVIGVPNVGKSTLINRLVSKKAVNIGNKPGITKSISWIRINKNIELLDTPGILWPRLDEEEVAYNLASMTAIKNEILPLDDVAVHVLNKLVTFYPEKLKERYEIDSVDFEDLTETYEKIGRRFGFLIKGGEVDYDKVTALIVKDIKDGYIKEITFDRI